MKTLLVIAHPRRNSLTAAVMEIFADTLTGKGHEIERADLGAENFDPVLCEADEPDWENFDKRYSDEVRREMARIERNDATVMFFPVYWWTMPALMKGWIDRVWNNGWAYGNRKLPQQRVWMIAVAGGDRNLFVKRGYDKAMVTQLDIGMLDYCGVRERRLEVLYGALDGEPAVDGLLAQARRIASEF